MTLVLRPEEWPFAPEYTRACERVMERMGVAEEDRKPLMGILVRLHGAPLAHLTALESAAFDWQRLRESASEVAARLKTEG